MSRAICIPFHRYQPHKTNHYRVFFDYFLNSLAKFAKEFDTLYLIDSDYGITDEDFQNIHKKFDGRVTVIQSPGSHWDNLIKIARTVVEDQVLFMDQDVLIWKPGVVDYWFKEAEKYDVYTAVDGSGSLGIQMTEKYGTDYQRMGTYYFILNRKALGLMSHSHLAPVRFEPNSYIKELDYYTEKEDWVDSLGYFTLKLLYYGFSIGKLYDNRSSVRLIDGKVTQDSLEADHIDGYYHVRNGNMIIYLLNSDNPDQQDQFDWTIEVSPKEEMLRILAWTHYMGLKEQEFIPLLGKLEIKKYKWDIYYNQFKEFHSIM